MCLDAMIRGIWHVTGAEGARGALNDEFIAPSRLKGNRSHHAAHMGAVAVFDFDPRRLSGIDPILLERQRSNTLGFLGRFDGPAYAIKFCEDLRDKLVGPAGTGHYQVPAVDDADGRYVPLYIPYFERWHVGSVSLECIVEVQLFDVTKTKVHALMTNEIWVQRGTFESLQAAFNAAQTNNLPERS